MGIIGEYLERRFAPVIARRRRREEMASVLQAQGVTPQKIGDIITGGEVDNSSPDPYYHPRQAG